MTLIVITVLSFRLLYLPCSRKWRRRKWPPDLRPLKLLRVQENQQLQKLLPRRHYNLRQRGSVNRMEDLGRRPKMLRKTMLWAKACQRTKSLRLKMMLKKFQVAHRILMMKIGLIEIVAALVIHEEDTKRFQKECKQVLFQVFENESAVQVFVTTFGFSAI